MIHIDLIINSYNGLFDNALNLLEELLSTRSDVFNLGKNIAYIYNVAVIYN
jgi:hypothetical protein